MSAIIGIFAIALMIFVLVVAAGSLLFVTTLPLARWRARRRTIDQQG